MDKQKQSTEISFDSRVSDDLFAFGVLRKKEALCSGTVPMRLP